MSTLVDHRFVLVTGKGGVGKTTVCAALALSLVARGKRVLVALCNAKERLSTMLGLGRTIGPDITAVADGLWAVNMQPQKALEEYGSLVLRSRMLSKTLFYNRYVHAFLRAVPGMQEWALLGKAWWHTTETNADRTFKYDVVILDAPATGHGLDMLRVPKVILDVVPSGLLRRDAERAWAMLKDPVTSAIVLVTAPEEMPTTETIELAEAIGQMGLRLGRVIVNGLLPEVLSPEERAALEKARIGKATSKGDEALIIARDRATRERVQAESLVRLSSELVNRPTILPLLMQDAAHPEAIRQLANLL